MNKVDGDIANWRSTDITEISKYLYKVSVQLFNITPEEAFHQPFLHDSAVQIFKEFSGFEHLQISASHAEQAIVKSLKATFFRLAGIIDTTGISFEIWRVREGR